MRLPGATTLEDLKAAWRETQVKRQGLLRADGSRRWDQCEGPIGACQLSMDRIGWYSPDGLVLIDDLGVPRRIDEISPTLWRILLYDVVQRFHERELGTKTGYDGIRGKWTCIDLVKTVARSIKTSAEGGRLLLAVACNAFWSKTRASQEGYVVENTQCALCGERHGPPQRLVLPAP